jgi:hypothetical protein
MIILFVAVGATYTDLMEQNLAALRKGLECH